MNLCVIVLTNDLKKDIKPPKYYPKVCYEVDGKTMIETVLERVVELKASRIILMVSKHELFYINKIIKHSDYSKLISYSLFDEKKAISASKRCYSGKNILVVPGNAPLLTTKGMLKMMSENRNIKINNSLFYLKKEYTDVIDNIGEYSIGDEELLSKKEIMIVESKADYDRVNEMVKKKRKFFKN